MLRSGGIKLLAFLGVRHSLHNASRRVTASGHRCIRTLLRCNLSQRKGILIFAALISSHFSEAIGVKLVGVRQVWIAEPWPFERAVFPERAARHGEVLRG